MKEEKIHLSIDLETYSSVELKKAGMYKYVESPDFELLLMAYSVDGGPVECVDFTNREKIPEEIKAALTDATYVKHAYNAAFEWTCLSKYLNQKLPIEQWRCTMVHGLYAGFPAGLEAIGKAIGLPEEKRKISEGKALIRYFCKPCTATKKNGGRTRNFPCHDPDRWKLFKEYCKQDVVTEMTVESRLAGIVVPDFVQKEWQTDLIINSRGVAVDMKLVRGAIELGNLEQERLMAEAVKISGLDNPGSIAQLKKWLETEMGEEIQALDKNAVKELMAKDGNSPEVKRMLEIRQKLGKTSTKKYNAIEQAVCDDGRVRGLLQFYGANRSGRWAGRLVQIQNLPRTHLEPLELARELVKRKKRDALEIIYGSVPNVLSQLIRTAFVVKDGKTLVDADFSAIEARVISWLAGENWKLEVFKTHGKIYEACASQMFDVPIERIVKGNPEYSLRQKGKVAELALGYQGGNAALIKMGALTMGIKESDLPDIVSRWRGTNKNIVRLWNKVEEAAKQVVMQGGKVVVRGLVIARELYYESGIDCMTIKLPSGRKLYYIEPKTSMNRWGKPSLSYMGTDQTNKKWKRIETYGGKLVENCVQGIARDCLAAAVERLEAAGMQVVSHVHDEVIIEGSKSTDLEKVIKSMTKPIEWAPDLPLGADGWTGTFFTKK